ncbi:cyclophilin-like fold protein [Candidatus Latescibacterota bacterium]
MPHNISIVIGNTAVPAELDDTPSGKAVFDRLPIESDFATWGDEIYFTIPVSLSSPDMVEAVSLGDLAYWPPGKAFCIFYGMTPTSTGNVIRPASAVIPLGKVTGDPAVFKKLARSARTVRLEKAVG